MNNKKFRMVEIIVKIERKKYNQSVTYKKLKQK